MKPLWLSADTEIKLSDAVAVPFPEYLLRADVAKLENFCIRIREMGYDGVIFGHCGEKNRIQKPRTDISQFLKLLNKYAIHWVIHPKLLGTDLKRCPVDPGFQELLKEIIKTLSHTFPEASGIFWESGLENPAYFSHSKAKYAIQADLVQEELNNLEQCMSGKLLFFYIPCSGLENAKRQASWLFRLQSTVCKTTRIVFSAFAGSPYEDHLPSHPCWEILGQKNSLRHLSLMPVINCGGLRQGEGLWPALTFDLFDTQISRLHRCRFAGAITLAKQIPAGRGFLDCNLTVGSKLQEKEGNADLLIDEWFREYKKEIVYTAYRPQLKKLRDMVIDLSLLKSETLAQDQGKYLIESMLSQLQLCECSFSKKRAPQILSDYFDYFAKDVRRMISHYALLLNINVSGRIKEDHQPSFWTQSTTGLSNPAKVVILDHPIAGLAGSRMESIFKENYFCI